MRLSHRDITCPGERHESHKSKWGKYLSAAGLILANIVAPACGHEAPKTSAESVNLPAQYGIWVEPYRGRVAQDENGNYYQESRFIVQFNDSISEAKTEAVIDNLGGRVVGQIPQSNGFAIESNQNVEDLMQTLSQDPSVRYVARNYYYTQAVTWDNDQYQSNGTEPTLSPDTTGEIVDKGLYWSNRIRLSNGLNLVQDSHQVLNPSTIAVVEIYGFDVTSTEIPFIDKRYQWDFGDSDGNVGPVATHPMWVSSFVAAVNNNQKTNGVAVTESSTTFKVLPIKIASDNALIFVDAEIRQIMMGDQFELAAALNYLSAVADLTNLSVVNISLEYRLYFGGLLSPFHIPNLFVTQAIKSLNNKNVIVVVAAGNGKREACDTLPASIDGVVSVGATTYSKTDDKERRALFSNYSTHNCLTVSAPGDNLLVFDLDGESTIQSGTSLAAPEVAGLVALIKSIKPDATYDEVVKLLRDNADEIVLDDDSNPVVNGQTWKRINVEKTMKALIWPKKLLVENAKVVSTTDNSYLALGTILSRFGVHKLDQNGSFIWQYVSEPHGNGRNYANDAVETSDGYLVIGEEETSDSPQNSWPIGNLVAVKLSFSGEIIWKKTYDHPTEEYGYDITQTSDGNFAITGTINGHPLFTLIDKDGNELQYQQLSYEGEGYSIYESQESVYLISGTSFLTNGTSNVIFTYNSDNSGALLTDFGLGFPLHMTPDGSLAFGMFHELSTGQSSGLLIGLDQNASAIWQRHLSIDTTITAAMTLSDGHIAAGLVSSGGNTNLWLGKVDESGNTIWETNLAVDSLCSVNSIVATQDGNFLVGVKFREGTSCTHSWLMKFDTDGNQKN